MAVFAQQARVAEHHLGHPRRHHLREAEAYAHQNQAGHELQLLRATPNAGRRPGTENPIRPLSEVQY